MSGPTTACTNGSTSWRQQAAQPAAETPADSAAHDDQILVFDTETSDLPRDWRRPASDLDNWPHLLQVAWIVCDLEFRPKHTYSTLIRPEGWQVAPGAAKVNGISTKKALKHGVPVATVLPAFDAVLQTCGLVAAHNLEFDRNVMTAEFLRAGLPHHFDDTEGFCTMRGTTAFCRLTPKRYGEYKWPTLAELHKICTGSRTVARTMRWETQRRCAVAWRNCSGRAICSSRSCPRTRERRPGTGASHPIRCEGRPHERYASLSRPRDDLRLLLPLAPDNHGSGACRGVLPPRPLMWSFAQRSYALVEGFLGAFDAWNLLVAAPLVRLQIDTLVRLSYAATRPDMDGLANYLLNGVEFRAMKDEDGKQLSDFRLVERVQTLHPWLKPVYDTACGWVHFSPLHLFVGTQATDGRLSGHLPLDTDVLSEPLLGEVFGAMLQATRELTGYLGMWAAHKEELAASHGRVAED